MSKVTTIGGSRVGSDAYEGLEDARRVLNFIRTSEPANGISADAPVHADGLVVALRWVSDRMEQALKEWPKDSGKEVTS